MIPLQVLSAVTDVKISASAAIARTKLVAGSASHVLVNDGAGLVSSVATLPVAQGGTGAANPAAARTALGLGDAATATMGMAPGNVIRPSDISICGAGEYLRLNVGPTYFWTCHSDASLDATKLPLAGGTMSGAIAMGTNKITGLGTPTAAADAATKAYVDSSVSDVSHWTLSSGNIYRSTGNVGIGTATPNNTLDVNGQLLIRGETGSDLRTRFITGKDSPGIGAGSLYLNYGNTNRVQIGDGTIQTNFFVANGKVMIGTASPTAHLQLKAGTATAGNAPLKLTAGTNLTTPEEGAIEFDGTNLYYTDSTNTRRTLTTSAGTYASGSTIQSASGSAGTPGLSFSGDTDTGF